MQLVHAFVALFVLMLYDSLKSHTPQMTVFAQQHPNHDAWGDTVTYTLVGDQVLVITDQQMIVMTREDARVEWAQNQHQGWRRIK